MANNKENLSFLFGLLPLLASLSNSLHRQLSYLSADTLAWIIVLAFIWCSVFCAISFLIKDKKIKIGPLQIEYRMMLTVPAMMIVILLLL